MTLTANRVSERCISCRPAVFLEWIAQSGIFVARLVPAPRRDPRLTRTVSRRPSRPLREGQEMLVPRMAPLAPVLATKVRTLA